MTGGQGLRDVGAAAGNAKIGENWGEKGHVHGSEGSAMEPQ